MTDPEPLWDHQRETLEASWHLPAYFLDWEPRLGKSRVAIETAAYLRAEGKIDAAVILAPSGVHLNWTREQLPRYWPEVDAGHLVEWSSARADGVGYRRTLEALLREPSFIWLAANSEALSTSKSEKNPGKLEAYLRRFLRARRTLLIVDESHGFKDPYSKRTKTLLRLAELAPYRRCLTGTPSPQGPFDLWAQYKVLDGGVALGPRFTTFRARYGVLEPRPFLPPRAAGVVVGYQRLDELRDLIAPITSVRKKADCLDLPRRLFARRYFELPAAHRRVYEELRRDALARLASGEEVTVRTALTLLLRLQQVSRGYVRPDSGDAARPLGAPYPAAEAAVDLVRGNPGKTIIWCRFVSDVDRVTDALAEADLGYVVCDGRTPIADRPSLRDRFSDAPAVRAWVGTAATGGVGVDLGAADLMIFYSQDYDAARRQQALERNFGSTQRAPRVEVVDLVAADTTDEAVLAALARKEALTELVRGTGLKKLLADPPETR